MINIFFLPYDFCFYLNKIVELDYSLKNFFTENVYMYIRVYIVHTYIYIYIYYLSIF